ncbi:hypothetical protein BGZ58_000615 [Dissophora ornata]|nr:hypothetical protein BGZ58_000615 [Dissophora ornata]
MSSQNPIAKDVPAVLIVGAGLGGLLLATLLERIDVPYHIFERAAEVQPLGAAMTLGANILPVFEQLGLLEEIEKLSVPCPSLDIYDASINKLGSIGLRTYRADTGYDNLIFARPKLYALLQKQVPASKISFGKKVLRTEERDGKVHIFCSDSTTYEGDILVGADGAYSGVRQNLYKRMDDKGVLPKSDLECLSIAYVSMVGVSDPPNPEKYPQLKDNFSHFSKVLDGSNSSWSAVSVANQQVCWMLSVQLSEAEAKAQQFRNSEWGPESNESMISEFEDKPCPWGGKMGEIMHATPKHLVSKVFLEEKLFLTWYHGRTVLIGDGAISSMQDAVVLANCFFNMPDATPASFTNAFSEYYRQRYDPAKEQFGRSNAMSKALGGQTWKERLLRHVILNYIPEFVQQRMSSRAFQYRPQIAWLPLAHNRGTGLVLPQEGARIFFLGEEEQTHTV